MGALAATQPIFDSIYLCQILTIGMPNGWVPISLAILARPSCAAVSRLVSWAGKQCALTVSMLWLKGNGGKYTPSRCSEARIRMIAPPTPSSFTIALSAHRPLPPRPLSRAHCSCTTHHCRQKTSKHGLPRLLRRNTQHLTSDPTLEHKDTSRHDKGRTHRTEEADEAFEGRRRQAPSLLASFVQMQR